MDKDFIVVSILNVIQMCNGGNIENQAIFLEPEDEVEGFLGEH